MPVMEKVTAKVFSHFRGFALLAKYRSADGSETFHRIIGQLPTRLKVVGSQKQNVVQELVRQFRSLDAGLRTIIEQAFPRRMILSCADSHASNLAAERADLADDQGWHHVLCRCFIHRVDTAEKRSTDLILAIVSGLVNLGVFFSHNMSALRKEMKRIIRQNVCWVVDCSDEAQEARDLLIRLFASDDASSTAAQKRGLAWGTLFNGDLRDPVRIQHVEKGCCADLEATKEKCVPWVCNGCVGVGRLGPERVGQGMSKQWTL
jgi:hypothetical protein